MIRLSHFSIHRCPAHVIAVLLAILFLSALPCQISGQAGSVLTENNEFGGQTVEMMNEDFSKTIRYYDIDGNLVKEETIFMSDYQIDNQLRKIVVTYYFGKKVKEEKVYTDRYVRNNLIESSIIHYDRNTGDVLMTENRFVYPYEGYNLVFRENNKKRRIEWYYPDNIDGIEKNVMYFDEDERIVKTESFFTPKTTRENGYYKRVYFTEFNVNQYQRKVKQIWYYTDEFAQTHNGIAKKIEHFHYNTGMPDRVETLFFDAEGNYIKVRPE